METLRADAVHTSASMHSALSCIEGQDVDDLKKREEELLYGTGEDDDEGALSDDSLRLRLSDDEAESGTVTLQTSSVPQQNKSTKNNSDPAPKEHKQSADLQKHSPKSSTAVNKNTEGKRETGNVSANEKVKNDQETHDMSEGDPAGSDSSKPSPPWGKIDLNRWRFSSSPRTRSFNHSSRALPSRNCYSMYSDSNRNESGNNSNRLRGTYTRGKRGRPCLHPKGQMDRKEKKLKTKQKSSSSSSQIVNGTQEMDLADVKQSTEASTLDNTKLNNVKQSGSHQNKVTDKKKTETAAVAQMQLKSGNEVGGAKNACSPSAPTKVQIKSNNDNNYAKSVSNTSTATKVQVKSNNEHNNTKSLSNTAATAKVQVKPSNETNNLKDSSKDSNDKSESIQSVGDCSKNGKTGVKVEGSNKESEPNSAWNNFDAGEVDKLVKKIIEIDDVQSDINKTKKSNISLQNDRKDKVEITSTNVEQEIEVKITDSSTGAKLSTKDTSTENAKTSKEEEKSIDNKETKPAETSKAEKIRTDSSNTKSGVIDVISIDNDADQKNMRIKVDNSAEPVSRKRTISPVVEQQKRPNKEVDSEYTTDVQKQEGAAKKETDDSAIKAILLQRTVVDREAKGIDVNEIMTAPKVMEKNEDSKSDKTKCGSNDKSLARKLHVLESDATERNVVPVTEGKNAEVVTTTQRRRRRTKKDMLAAQEAAAFSEDKQGSENGRQKRRTAKNAEEIIRKKFLNHDSDGESSDNSDKFVIVNHKMSLDARCLSPPSLKRGYPDAEPTTLNGSLKKIKVHPEALKDESTNKHNHKHIKNLSYVHKFFQRDLKEKLPKLKQEELEELLIQKIVETITMRSEIGKLREQARISERNQEATRARCQQLAKQIKDFEMVLRRNAEDQRANNGKPTAPIKINRSVGLQVNFMTEHGMQNLRQLQQVNNIKAMITNGVSSSTAETTTTSTSPRRGIKVRSPRKSDQSASKSPVMTQSQMQSPALVSTVTPAALVVTKPFESQHTLTVPAAVNNQQLMATQQQSQQSPQQAIVINGKVPSQTTRSSTTISVSKGKQNDLIDLTDEEEKSKTAVSAVAATTEFNIVPKAPQPCFQRVIQTIPGNVSLSSQPTSIRVVQPASQPTPTALVNNMNASRVAYVMQGGVGSPRQLIITSNSNQMRPVTSGSRAPFSAVTYKTGISTIANGTVRVLTTPAGHNLQTHKHPAPLPDAPNYTAHPVWKLPPPAPSLKISKVANGIVLSWNMALTDKYADIASYQLYAYQEVSGVPPNTALWKKVGDVRALPLPMACTLTQFSEGNNYYFAVRAVDTHSRKGQYSIPGNISL